MVPGSRGRRPDLAEQLNKVVMKGFIITGINMLNEQCEGQILDKVLTLQTLQIKGQGIGQVQQIPFALDAYLIIDDCDGIHLVQPHCITSIKEPVLRPEN